MRSRERACPCLHRVWCRTSHSCLRSCECGSFFLQRAGRCVASRLRKVTASHCLTCAYTVCTPRMRSGRWRTFERRQLRTSVWTLVSLSVLICSVLCVRETCRVHTCGRVSVRARVCTGCGAGRHAAVFCRLSVGLFSFSVRGAVWRRVCGRSPPPGPKGATSTSALTARFAPSRYAHAEEVTCPLALSSSDSVSSRRLSVSVSARASLG